MSLNKPNSNQATQSNLAGKISDTLQKWLRGEVDDMLPATVVSYNDTTNRAVIRPIVMVGTTSGGKVPRAQIPNIPVFRFGGGGYFMRHPIKPGDFGWIKANDRDISLIMQAAGKEEWPNTERLHSFSDAMFFPDTVKDWIIAGGNVDGSVWQSMDGTRCIALNETSIDVLAPNINATATEKIFATAPEITASATTSITASAPTINLTATILNIDAATVAIVGSSLTHNGVSVGSTHKHDGVTIGSGNTGEPI